MGDKSDKCLLEILLGEYIKYYDKYSYIGLCNLIDILHSRGTYSLREYGRIHYLIDINRPDFTDRLGYWWPIRCKKCRVDFLTKLIKEYDI